LKEPTLKADPTAQLRLLDLQAVDSRLDQLSHRLEHLPEAAALAEVARRQAELTSAHTRLRTEVDDLAREQRKADADVEQVKSRRARNQERIDAGQIADPRQLQAMQHEIETLDRRISDLEDAELDVLERLETAQTELARVVSELSAIEDEVAKATTARDAAAADITAQQGTSRTEREALVGDVPEPLLTLYDRLRAQREGVGAGAIQHGRCGGCRLDIGAAELARIAAAPSDEVLRCEECNRILLRTPDSGI
jgi:predicted  nucleic acid-binding Zn-ribbon protein